MREITSHIHPEYDSGLRVTVQDEPGPGGANHHYSITANSDPYEKDLAEIVFQKGPVSENGHNGILEGPLVAILIDRYRSFQDGPFPSEEGAVILNHLLQVEGLIHRRVSDRVARGVMSKMAK